jgi:hypothetical protein
MCTGIGERVKRAADVSDRDARTTHVERRKATHWYLMRCGHGDEF